MAFNFSDRPHRIYKRTTAEGDKTGFTLVVDLQTKKE